MPNNSDQYDTPGGGDTDRALYPPVSINQAARTAEVETEFLVVPNRVSTFRDYIPDGQNDDSDGANDGTVSFNDGQYTLSTPGTAVGEQQAFETARIGTYRPGHVALSGIYARKETPPAGVAEWGYKREGADDGFFVRYNSDGTLEFVIVRGGVETVIPQSEWGATTNRAVTDENGDASGRIWGFDAFDGTGQSSVDLDPAHGYIYRFDWAWYGGAAIALNIVTVNNRGYQRPWPAVLYEPTGQPSFNQPNQPLFGRLDTQGATAADSLVIQGRQHSILGSAQDRQRRTEHRNSGVSVPDSTDTEIITFRRKPQDSGIEMDVVEADIQTDQTLHGYLTVDPDFNTAPTWTTPSGVNDASETAIEVEDGSDANLGTGDPYGGFLLGTGKNSQSLSGIDERDFPIIRQKPVVLVLASTSGQTATVDVSLKVGEKW